MESFILMLNLKVNMEKDNVMWKWEYYSQIMFDWLNSLSY